MKKEQAQKLLELVRRNYQEIAVHFDATRRKELWPEARRLAEEVKEGDYVLDAGCGNGRLLEAWPNKKINYFGFDNSAELINLARQNYPDQKFFVGDILESSLVTAVAKERFDHIFCLAVLPHIPSRELQREVLKKLAARLQTGGRLIISAWNFRGNHKYRALIFKSYGHKILGRDGLGFKDLVFPWKNASGQIISQRYYHAFSQRELEKLALSAGLEISGRKKDRYNYWFILQNR